VITVTHLKESVQLNHNRQLQEVVRSILEGSIPKDASYDSGCAQLSIRKIIAAATLCPLRSDLKNAIIVINPGSYNNLMEDSVKLRSYAPREPKETHDFITTALGKTLLVQMPNIPKDKAYLIGLKGEAILEEKTVIQVGPVAIVHNKDFTLVDIDVAEVCEINNIVSY
jgi:hypothetical protein